MSSTEPDVVHLAPTTTAVIRAVVAEADLRDFFDRSFATLARVIAEQGVTITGPAFSLYHDHPAATMDVEVGFTTDRPVTPTDGVHPSELPGGRVVRVVHEGAYEELPDAWDRLSTWMDDRGLGAGMPFWEVYLTAPTPDADPTAMRTELNLPVAD
jgi:effector-binding domain-containing protein